MLSMIKHFLKFALETPMTCYAKEIIICLKIAEYFDLFVAHAEANTKESGRPRAHCQVEIESACIRPFTKGESSLMNIRHTHLPARVAHAVPC
jgi:hypothetical protein